MPRILSCGDIVPGCDAEVRAESDDEVMRQAADHAAKAHGVTQVDPALAAKIKAAIREG